MLVKNRLISLVLVFVLLVGCNRALPTPTLFPQATSTSPFMVITAAPAATSAVPVPTAKPTNTVADTPVPLATVTAASGAPTATTASGAPTAASATGSTQPEYLDDRSTPSGLVLSLFNALNRKEFLRAYSYWQNPTNNPNVGTYDHFQKGYQDLASVQVTLGTISSGVGAGQTYYSVPVVLKSQTTSGQAQTFAGCYTLHLANPSVQTAPPFQSLGIQSADMKTAAASADPNTLLNSACPPAGGTPTPIPTTDPNTIAASNYLDNRSTAVMVLSSLFNAVNRKEYARAYSYWQNPPDPYTQFQQGYLKTAWAEATFGTPTSDAGGGQMRYRVPVRLKAQTTDGKTQYFAGCYQLRLSQPSIQGTPPFRPMGIEKALVKTAVSETDAVNQMATACTNMP